MKPPYRQAKMSRFLPSFLRNKTFPLPSIATTQSRDKPDPWLRSIVTLVPLAEGI
jgi:hypothetical protein